MKLRNSKIIYVLFVCLYLFTSSKSFAQKDILYFLREAPQVTQYNPAITPNNNFYITLLLGTTDIGVHTSGFSYHDLIHKHPIYSDSLQLDLENFRNRLSDDNFINFNYDMDLFGFGFKAGKNYFNYDLSLNIDTRLNFSKGIFDLILDGSSVEGGNIRILDGHFLELNAYIANAFGYARQINDKLHVGAKVKVLTGLANIHTNDANLEVKFENNEKISVHGEIDILTSNIFGDISINSLFTENANAEFIMNQNLNQIISQGIQNMGVSFDLGASYRLLDNLELSISAVDVFSFLNWKTHASQIVNNKPYEEIVFEGITSSIDSIESNIENQLTTIKDSLISALDISSQSLESYSTHLPAKLYFGATYNFGKVNYIHALLNTKIAMGKIYDTHLSLFYSLHTRHLSLSFGNMFRSANFFNPSALISFKLSGSQIYLGGNLHTNKSFNVADFNGLDVFAGINISVGKKNYWEKEKFEKEIIKQEVILEQQQPVNLEQQPTSPEQQPVNVEQQAIEENIQKEELPL